MLPPAVAAHQPTQRLPTAAIASCPASCPSPRPRLQHEAQGVHLAAQGQHAQQAVLGDVVGQVGHHAQAGRCPRCRCQPSRRCRMLLLLLLRSALLLGGGRRRLLHVLRPPAAVAAHSIRLLLLLPFLLLTLLLLACSRQLARMRPHAVQQGRQVLAQDVAHHQAQLRHLRG